MDQESVKALRERLEVELTGWQRLRRHYTGQLSETHVVLDKGERTIERVDHPRVPHIPTLRYGRPDPGAVNWTLLRPAQATQLVADLDRHQPAFAPHRAQDIRGLIQDRIAAAARGLEILQMRGPEGRDEEDEAQRHLRP